MTRAKKNVVRRGLRELVQSRKTKKNFADLAGRIRFRKNYDYKAARKLRG